MKAQVITFLQKQQVSSNSGSVCETGVRSHRNVCDGHCIFCARHLWHIVSLVHQVRKRGVRFLWSTYIPFLSFPKFFAYMSLLCNKVFFDKNIRFLVNFCPKLISNQNKRYAIPSSYNTLKMLQQRCWQVNVCILCPHHWLK